MQHRWLGFVDSGLPEGDPLPPLPEGCFALEPLEVTAEAAGPGDPRVPAARHDDVRRERRLPAPRPHHVPHGVDGGVRTRPATPRRYPHAGEPWQPLKIYYNQTFSRARIVAFHDALDAAGRGVARTPSGSSAGRTAASATITTRVECSAYFEQRDQALLAHATQVDPDGTWFPSRARSSAEIWPTEDYEAAPVLRARSPRSRTTCSPGWAPRDEATELATSTGLQIAFDAHG